MQKRKKKENRLSEKTQFHSLSFSLPSLSPFSHSRACWLKGILV